MSEKLTVECEEVDEILTFRGLVNRTPLKDIVWTRGEKPIEIPAKQVGDFLDTGLSNVDFYRYNFWSDEGRKEAKE